MQGRTRLKISPGTVEILPRSHWLVKASRHYEEDPFPMEHRGTTWNGPHFEDHHLASLQMSVLTVFRNGESPMGPTEAELIEELIRVTTNHNEIIVIDDLAMVDAI
jgi:hypothetical protein